MIEDKIAGQEPVKAALREILAEALTLVTARLIAIMHADLKKRSRFTVKKRIISRPLSTSLSDGKAILPFMKTATATTDSTRPSQLEARVPYATPLNPRPMPKEKVRLSTMLTTLVRMATAIGQDVDCIPTNHPLTAMVESSAGLPQMQTRK